MEIEARRQDPPDFPWLRDFSIWVDKPQEHGR